MDHLRNLLGQGTAQDAFIHRMSSQRFGGERLAKKPAQPASQTAFPSLSSSARPKPSNFNSGSSGRGRDPGSTHLAAPRPGTLPRTASPAERSKEKLSSQFGSSGNIYVKDRGLEPPSSSRNKKSHVKSNEHSGQSTPVGTSSRVVTPSPSTSAPEPKGRMPEAGGTPNTNQLARPHAPATLDIPIELPETVLRELYHFDRILKSLRDGRVSTKPASSCFCSGTLHGLPRNPLPPLCLHCGMIYCGLKLPMLPCPSCAKPDDIWSSPSLKESILLHFEGQRDRLVDSEFLQHQRAEQRQQHEAELVRQAERSFPSLGTSHPKTPAQMHHQSYVSHLTGGPSMQDRIREGYEKLAEDSRTVLRLDSKSGKAKIVTTMKKVNPPKADKSAQARNRAIIQALEADELGTSWIDDLDDGERLSRGMEVLLSVPVGHVRDERHTAYVPEYIPVTVYQHDV